MNKETLELKDGIKAHLICTDKYKTDIACIILTTELKRESVTKNALIPFMLKRGTQKYPSQYKINVELDNMYGASFNCGVDKYGDNVVLKFFIETINNSYSFNNDNILEKSLNMLLDIVFDPVKENGHLSSDIFNSEKENLKKIIESKIDNLADMKRALEAGNKQEEKVTEEAEENSAPEKRYGVVAVSLGNGFSQFFTELNVDQIVEGGQTMNPSVDDLMNAIRQVKAECVYVLPNNGNVIFAANQAAELSPNDVRVIPTKNVAMGIAAAIAFQNDAEPDENMQRMTEAAQHVKTAMVTYAIRDSEYNGIEIKQGDIIGLHNGQIEFSGHSVHDVVLEMMKEIVTDEDELITVYYGADVSEEDAKAIAEEIEEQYEDCDVEYHNGGQPLYYYLISVE